MNLIGQKPVNIYNIDGELVVIDSAGNETTVADYITPPNNVETICNAIMMCVFIVAIAAAIISTV